MYSSVHLPMDDLDILPIFSADPIPNILEVILNSALPKT